MGAMKVGDIFAVPLPVGGFGAAIAIDTTEGLKFLVIDGFWKERPAAADFGDIVEVMPLPFGQKPLPDRPNVFKGWFRGDVPADFQVAVNRRLTARQKAMGGAEGTMVFQSARDFARRLSDLWRWLNDRPAYLHELQLASAAAESVRAGRRANLSLESMLSETFFTDWDDRWTGELLIEARGIFNDATAKLVALREGGPPSARTAVLRKIVEEFNRLYDATGLVESVERDEIVQRIEELATLVGLDNADEKLTGHRTW
jgi:hypothetical protein